MFFFTGGVQILPTIAYLITNILKELGELNNFNEISKQNISIQTVLDSFQVLCKHPYGYHKVSENKWRSLLQSTIAKLIDISKTGNGCFINILILILLILLIIILYI